MRPRLSRCAMLCTLLPALCAAPAVAMPEGQWSAGLLAIVRDVPYRQTDTDVTVVPALQYEGPRAYLRGLRLGWRMAGDRSGGPDLILQARMDGYAAKDSPYFDGMATRRRSLDGGLAWRQALGFGVLDASLTGDLLGRHRGQQATLAWGYPWQRGRLLLQPQLGLRWWSARSADYYAGVRPEEARPDRPAYRPGSALIREAGVGAVYRIDTRWTLFGRLGYERLPDSLSHSPLVDAGDAWVGLFGVTRRF